MASCVRNIRTKNYQNLIIGFQFTVKNVGDAFFETQRKSRSTKADRSRSFDLVGWPLWLCNSIRVKFQSLKLSKFVTNQRRHVNNYVRRRLVSTFNADEHRSVQS